MVVALQLLNLAGGEAVQSLENLEQDEGLMANVRGAEAWGQRGREPAQERWRRECQRTLPSPSAVFRYLEAFVGEDEGQRAQGQALIPQATVGLQGLRAVNTHVVSEVQSVRCHAGHGRPDAIGETGKAETLVSYRALKPASPCRCTGRNKTC